MILEHIDRNYDAAYYTGEPVVLEYQETDASGAVISLAGRSFQLAVFRAEQPDFGYVTPATIADDVATFVFAGFVTEAFDTIADGRYELAERVTLPDNSIAKTPLVAGRFTVEESAGVLVSSGAQTVIYGAVTRVERKVVANAPRLVVSARGAPGKEGDQGAQGIPGPIGGYTILPAGEGVDQRAEFRAALGYKSGVVSLAPRSTYYVRSAATLDNRPSVAQTWDPVGLTLEGNGAIIRQMWDPADPTTLGGLFDFRRGRDVTIRNVTYEPFPRIDTQGVITAVSGSDFYLAVQPGFEPQGWTTADNMLRIALFDDGEYGVSAWKYKVAGQSRPFPFVPYLIAGMPQTDARGWAIYKGSPVDVGLNPNTVLSYNPLTFRMTTGTLGGGETMLANGFTGTLGTILNGKTFVAQVPDEDNPTSYTLLDAAGATINASAASGETLTTGSFIIAAVPAWVTAGATLVVQCRKRGSNPFYTRGVKGRLALEGVTIRGASSVPFFLWDGDDLYLDVTLRGDGYLASNGGPVNIFNFRTVTGPGITCYGSGDDVFYPRTRSWQSRIDRWDIAGGWVDVRFNVDSAFGNNPTAPTVGDLIDFTPINVLTEQQRTVASVQVSPLDPTATRVTFTAALPATFDATTSRVINRSTVPVVNLDHIYSMASAARAFIPGTHNARIGRLTAIGTCFSPLLGILALGGQTRLGDGGFRGNVVIDTLETSHVALGVLNTDEDQSSSRAVVKIIARNLDQTVLSAPTGYPPVIIGEWIGDDYPYAGIVQEGVDVVVLSRTLRRNGTLRPTPSPTSVNNFDYSSSMGQIVLHGAAPADTTERLQELSGGSVTVLGGSGLRATGTLAAGAVTLTAAKNVLRAADVEVRIGGGPPLAPTSYTTDGSAVLTLAAAPITSGDPIAYSVVHTRS